VVTAPLASAQLPRAKAAMAGQSTALPVKPVVAANRQWLAQVATP
jgi:hypothetical protein